MAEPKGKGKFGALIQEARKPETQKSKEVETQKTRNTASRRAKKPEILQAAEPETQKYRKSTSQKQVEPVAIDSEEMVNLGIKVPKSWRRHWAAEAKRHDITMTEVMVEALTETFGLPN
jgi:hypothetical protein